MEKARQTYIPELDGLRAMAIILVLFRHILLFVLLINENKPIMPVWGYDIFTLPLNGWVGVDLFFVLSGYLISSQFFKGKPTSIPKYALRRILRIFPAYYFVLVVCTLGLFPYFKVLAGENIWQSFIYHLIFMHDYTGSDINSVFWSLAVEEKFYIVVPFIVWFLIFFRKRLGELGVFAIVLALIVLGIYLRINTVPYEGRSLGLEQFLHTYRFPFHCCIEPFMFGILVSFLRYQSKLKEKISLHAPKIFYAGLFIGLMYFSSHTMLKKIDGFDVTFQPTLIAFIMFLIVLGTVMGGGPKILKSSFLNFISRMSYSLYLVHWPVYPSALILASRIMGGDNSSLLFILVFASMALALSFSAAIAVFFCVERPFLRIKDRI